MMMLLPFVKIGAVGLAGHIIERKLERNGYGGRVIVVKIATYVVCGLITYAEWRKVIYAMGRIWGIHVVW